MNSSFLRTKCTTFSMAFIGGIILGTAGTAIGANLLGSDVFDDVPQGSFYDSAVGEMYRDGVIKGYAGTDNFGPNDNVTRGQIAVMLQRFKDEINGTASNDDDNGIASSKSSRSSSTSSVSSKNSSYAYSANPKGTIRFTTTAYTVGENVSTANITVVRIGGNEGSVSVNYAVTAGTASVDSDFEIISGTLSFANKETSKTFTVKIKDDSTSEGNETINIALSSPTNGVSIGSPSTAILTILDNESSSGGSNSSSQSTSSANPSGTLSFSAFAYTINENAGNITVTVNRTGGTTGTVSVNYATSNGTGVSGTDYTATNGTLTFTGGESSKTFTVNIGDETSVDGSKTFNIALSAVTGGATLGSPSTTSVTMYDNESATAFGTGSLKFSKTSYDFTESSGKAEVVVQRVSGTIGTVSVNYATVNGSAFSGPDYTTTSGTLTFAPGESSKIISIPLVKDTSSETGDNFYVELTSPTAHAELISPYSTTVNIFD